MNEMINPWQSIIQWTLFDLHDIAIRSEETSCMNGKVWYVVDNQDIPQFLSFFSKILVSASYD